MGSECLFLYFLAACLMATSQSQRHSTKERLNIKEKIDIPKPTPEIRLPSIFDLSQVNVTLNREQCKRSEFQSLRSCTRKILSNQATHRYLRRLRDLTKPRERGPSSAGRGPSSEGRGPSPTTPAEINPCKGQSQRVAVLVANDLNGATRELVFDPDNLLYQTIVVENCAERKFNNFNCRLHNITFEAVVFSTDPTSNDISVQDVTTPAYCALTTNLKSKI